MSDTTHSLSDDLRAIPTLTGLNDETYDWLAERMQLRTLEPGELLVEAGGPADSMFVLFEGEIHGQRDNGTLFVISAGQISGLLPYSRLKTYPASMRVVRRARSGILSARHFPEMLERFPELGQRLVGLMSDRIREITRADVQREKLVSLGKLSAGLAHELNNPASATRRAAESLREAVTRLREINLQLAEHQLSREQREHLAAFEQQWFGATSRRPADALEQSDREQAIGDWLQYRMKDGWSVAAGLAEAGLDTPRLEEFASHYPSAALGDVLRRLSGSLLVGRLVDEIENASARISDLVKAIKEYSYMDQGPVQDIDIHRGLESTLLILKHQLKQGVTVVREYDQSMPMICARASELNQVWTNLIDNAIDAMAGKGVLKIRTVHEPDCALVEIIDNGTGIADEIKDRIFDPFFTTKQVGEGTGLGLDVVHRIVRQHQGDVRFESRPGETKFQVRLPLQPKGAK